MPGRFLALTFLVCGPTWALPLGGVARQASYLQIQESSISADHSLSHLEALTSVVKGEYTHEVSSAWSEYQEKMLHALHAAPSVDRSFVVLVVSSVSDTAEEVTNFEYNMKKLQNNDAGDTFEFALHHHDNSNEHWEKRSWYANESGPVVLKELGPGCKVAFWGKVEPKLVKNYDYVWLLDEDMRLDFFSWDLYRHFLATLDPLVTQPSIVASHIGKRSSNKAWLRMEGPLNGNFAIAHEVNRTEVQAPMLSSRIWDAVYARLQQSDIHSEKYISDFWDTAAVMSKLQCQKPNVLIVNACPLRHMNYHSQAVQKVDCLGSDIKTNNRPLTRADDMNLAEAMKDYCGAMETGKNRCKKAEHLRQCHMRLNLYEHSPRFKAIKTWWGVHLKGSTSKDI